MDQGSDPPLFVTIKINEKVKIIIFMDWWLELYSQVRSCHINDNFLLLLYNKDFLFYLFTTGPQTSLYVFANNIILSKIKSERWYAN